MTFVADYPSKMRIDDIAQKTRNEIREVRFDENGHLAEVVEKNPRLQPGRRGFFSPQNSGSYEQILNFCNYLLLFQRRSFTRWKKFYIIQCYGNNRCRVRGTDSLRPKGAVL